MMTIRLERTGISTLTRRRRDRVAAAVSFAAQVTSHSLVTVVCHLGGGELVLQQQSPLLHR
jgi:hypothetical protein